jgi:hypothetical protein
MSAYGIPTDGGGNIKQESVEDILSQILCELKKQTELMSIGFNIDLDEEGEGDGD